VYGRIVLLLHVFVGLTGVSSSGKLLLSIICAAGDKTLCLTVHHSLVDGGEDHGRSAVQSETLLARGCHLRGRLSAKVFGLGEARWCYHLWWWLISEMFVVLVALVNAERLTQVLVVIVVLEILVFGHGG
jgi:hypothetical protein